MCIIYIYIQYTHNIWYIIYYNQCFAYVCLNILLADWPKFPGLNLREKAIDASQNFGDKCRSNDAAELRYISTACLLFVMSPDTNCLVSSSFFYFRFFSGWCKTTSMFIISFDSILSMTQNPSASWMILGATRPPRDVINVHKSTF